MPFPIKLVHELEEHNEIFNETTPDDLRGLSGLQAMFLGSEMERKAAKQKYTEQTIAMLEEIQNNKDNLSNAAASFMNPQRQANTLFKVPTTISDHDLLGLKTQGLITGSGRSVNLTSKGTVALRDKWLSETNNLEANRVKDKFEYRQADKKSKFKKIGTSEE